MPAMPAKPKLPGMMVNPDGGVTMDRDSTERLGRYILELERGYNLP